MSKAENVVDLDEVRNDLKKIKKKHDIDSVSDEGMDEFASRFEKKFRKIRKQISSEDGFIPAQTGVLMLRTMLSMSVDMIPIAEATYRKYKSERAMYALIALMSQAREISNDLRSMEDGTELVDRIMSTIINPILSLVAQQIFNELVEMRGYVYDKVEDRYIRRKLRKRLDKMRGEFAEFIKQSQQNLDGQLKSLLEKN